MSSARSRVCCPIGVFLVVVGGESSLDFVCNTHGDGLWCDVVINVLGSLFAALLVFRRRLTPTYLAQLYSSSTLHDQPCPDHQNLVIAASISRSVAVLLCIRIHLG